MVSFNSIFVFASAFFTLAFSVIFFLSRTWADRFFPSRIPGWHRGRYLYAAGLLFGCTIYLLGQAALEYARNSGKELVFFWHRFQHLGLFVALFYWPLLVANYARVRVNRLLLWGGAVLGIGLSFCTIFTSLFIEDRLRLMNGWARQGEEGPLYLFFQVWALAVLIVVLMVFYQNRRKKMQTNREVLLVVTGSLIAAITALYDMLGTFLPVQFFNKVSIFSYGIVIMCFIFSYEMSRETIRTSGKLVRANITIKKQEQLLVESTRFELVGKLASGIVHDLRNVFSIVLLGNSNLVNYAARLPELEVSADIKEVLELQGKSIDIAGFLLENLSHFARGDIVVDMTERFLALDALNELARLLDARLKKQKVVFQLDVSKECTLKGNRGHFTQAILNLLLNAIEVIHGPGTISIRSESAGEQKACFYFSDSGPGIPQEQRAQVFDFLFSTKESGSGIGLFITKKIVEKNRGSIRVTDSAPGCTFELLWPSWRA